VQSVINYAKCLMALGEKQ